MEDLAEQSQAPAAEQDHPPPREDNPTGQKKPREKVMTLLIRTLSGNKLAVLDVHETDSIMSVYKTVSMLVPEHACFDLLHGENILFEDKTTLASNNVEDEDALTLVVNKIGQSNEKEEVTNESRAAWQKPEEGSACEGGSGEQRGMEDEATL